MVGHGICEHETVVESQCVSAELHTETVGLIFNFFERGIKSNAESRLTMLIQLVMRH
jgi:hypothetical protein